MKKLSILLTLVTFAMCSFGQIDMKSANNNTVDTVANTGTKYMTSQKIGGNIKSLAVAVTLTEISGTTGGTLTLEASLDGVTWYPLYQSYSDTTTFTPADVATQAFRWLISPSEGFGDTFVRVKYTGTGTMSTKISAKYLARLE